MVNNCVGERLVRRKNGIKDGADCSDFPSGEFTTSESKYFVRLVAPVYYAALSLHGFGHQCLTAVTGEVVRQTTANTSLDRNAMTGVALW